MDKLRQHFVPQFYLRIFSSAPKRINLINLNRSLAIEKSSLRDQCFKKKFYGNNDTYENALSIIEGYGAIAIHQIIKTFKLPASDSDENFYLLTFIATQMQRTTKAVENIQTTFDGFNKLLLKHDPRFSTYDFEKYKIELADPAIFLLSLVEQISFYLGLLKRVLVCCRNDLSFITSDNPIAKYNQFNEGLGGITGITGLLSRGIQIAIPLSPKHLLLLFDGETYSQPVDIPELVQDASVSDISILNFLQVINAESNIYFSDWSKRHDLLALVEKAKPLRKKMKIYIDEFPEESKEGSSLIVSHNTTPNLHFDLSFLPIKRRLRKMSAKERLKNRYNKDPLNYFGDENNKNGAIKRTQIFKKP